ncbi:MAG: type II toxin-antitoxin system RelB/DinJ family antitoxin [Defluviitaleaceae bacterium]|nr:type II toxin-antitoxin system RelB/DinJ family antitoxin [Defluviitaleaceae bacterium]
MSTVVNVRVDENVKRDVENLFDNLGMNVSTAVNMFFKQCLAEDGIPFQPRIKKPDPHMQARKQLKAVFEEMQAQSAINGTDDMSLDEINAIIKECRQEAYR